jgi:predicted ATPase
LPSDFPPLRTVPTTVPTNLPTPLTTFVGRTAELQAAAALLAGSRLVTLTGPGGTGKTRMSIELGRSRLHAYPGGVWFVQLDVVRDPALVLPEVARTLGVADAPGEPPVAAIARQIEGRPVLVILDNLEQVVAAAPDIAALLGAAPDLTILATSRESLAIAGEQVFSVPPLAVPDEPAHPTAATVGANDCVALFVERARAARADFVLSDANAAAVAAICRRLDGLPLAIELAAARVNLLAPEQILARMDHRLNLLASSRRDLTDRQRTLRGAIDGLLGRGRLRGGAGRDRPVIRPRRRTRRRRCPGRPQPAALHDGRRSEPPGHAPDAARIRSGAAG